MTSTLRPYLGHFLAQLEAAGLQDAVVAPGSRSTPLAVLLRESTAIRVRMALDERSGAYFALGIAKATGRPVALLCTSGTAAANFLPAVAEASLSRVPLIVLTADRPRELRDVGAAQTIDQVQLYGGHVKWFQDLPTPGTPNLERHAAQVAARAVHRAMSHPQGPVHLNFPVREPLLPESGPGAAALMGPQFEPCYPARSEGLDCALEWIGNADFPIIALGPEAPAVDATAIETARDRGWPILADPLAANGRPSGLISGYDTFLRATDDLPHPDVVVRLGAPFTSKAFNQWCRHARLVLLDWPLGFRDPDHLPSLVLEGDPKVSLAQLAARLPQRTATWADQLQTWETWVDRRIEAVVEESPGYFEGRFYTELEALWAVRRMPVLVASSMPVRDVDTFYRHGSLTFFANRGANGIDGLISTAMGIAAHHGDVLAILGDLAFYHDMNGLLLAQQHQLNAFFVIINNSGGAIFSFLPQSSLPAGMFEELFGTPHQLDFSGVGALYGAEFRRAEDFQEFRRLFWELRDLPGLRVLEWRTTPRTETVAIHRRLYERVD